MTIVPISRPPSISGLMIPTTIGIATGISAGSIISLIAEPVTIVDRARVVGPRRALHDPRVLPELAPHLLDDLAADAADRLHRERGEQERHQAADEEAGDHPRVAEAEETVSAPPPRGRGRTRRRGSSAASPAEPIA